MKKLATLRKLFKAANKRVDKAIDRYKGLIDALWVEKARGELVHATPACFSWHDKQWHFREFATDSYDAFYRRGRGEKRLAESWGAFRPFNVKRIDIAAIKKLEAKMEAAFSERERLLDELEAAGVDVWHDADLWQ